MFALDHIALAIMGRGKHIIKWLKSHLFGGKKSKENNKPAAPEHPIGKKKRGLKLGRVFRKKNNMGCTDGSSNNNSNNALCPIEEDCESVNIKTATLPEPLPTISRFGNVAFEIHFTKEEHPPTARSVPKRFSVMPDCVDREGCGSQWEEGMKMSECNCQTALKRRCDASNKTSQRAECVRQRKASLLCDIPSTSDAVSSINTADHQCERDDDSVVTQVRRLKTGRRRADCVRQRCDIPSTSGAVSSINTENSTDHQCERDDDSVVTQVRRLKTGCRRMQHAASEAVSDDPPDELSCDANIYDVVEGSDSSDEDDTSVEGSSDDQDGWSLSDVAVMPQLESCGVDVGCVVGVVGCGDVVGGGCGSDEGEDDCSDGGGSDEDDCGGEGVGDAGRDGGVGDGGSGGGEGAGDNDGDGGNGGGAGDGSRNSGDEGNGEDSEEVGGSEVDDWNEGDDENQNTYESDDVEITLGDWDDSYGGYDGEWDCEYSGGRRGRRRNLYGRSTNGGASPLLISLLKTRPRSTKRNIRFNEEVEIFKEEDDAVKIVRMAINHSYNGMLTSVSAAREHPR